MMTSQIPARSAARFVATSLLAVFALGHTSIAALISEDLFPTSGAESYTAGPLAGQSPDLEHGFSGTDAWTVETNDAQDSWTVDTGSLSYTDSNNRTLANSGGKVQLSRDATLEGADPDNFLLAFRALESSHANTETYYFSGLINFQLGSAAYVAVEPGGKTTTLIGFNSAGNAQVGRLNSSGDAIAQTNTSASVFSPGVHFVVGKVEYVVSTSSDILTMWVDPDLDAEPGTFTAQSTGDFYHAPFGLDGIGFVGDTSPDSLTEFDAHRIGTTWADVTIPEPSSALLLSLGGLGLLGRGRRRAG